MQEQRLYSFPLREFWLPTYEVRLVCLERRSPEYSSLDSTHSTEELSDQKRTPKVFRAREEDDNPLLDFLLTRGSFDADQETVPDDRPQQNTASRTKKSRIKWQKASGKTLWKQINEGMDKIPEACLQ